MFEQSPLARQTVPIEPLLNPNAKRSEKPSSVWQSIDSFRAYFNWDNRVTGPVPKRATVSVL